MNELKRITGILLILIVACQADIAEVPFRTEFKVMSLEIALLKQDHGNIALLAGEVIELLNDFHVQSNLAQNAKGDALRLLEQIKTGYYNPNHFEELALLKEDLMILFNSNEYKDEHLDALWHYGNSLLTATSTARDPLMDLYEWNEFEMQVKDLKGSWELLERQKPSMSLLRYNNAKVTQQSILFDKLNIAMQTFMQKVEDGISPTEVLCEKADELRTHYIAYLEMLVHIEENENLEEALK